MTLIAASIAVHGAEEVSAALERARASVGAGANLIEWRIDALAEESDAFGAASRLVRDCPLPCIVTCRALEEGGEYRGDEPTRISLLEALAASDSPPRYIDIELAAFGRSENMRQKVHLAVDHPCQVRDLATSLILSSHDAQARPANLIQRIEAMIEEPACAVAKIAWHARSLRDNLEAFELLRDRRKPMIALCMGRFGLMSRVLAPKFGGFLTFATDREMEVTAPGQSTIDQLRQLYRFDRIAPKTKVYGVIGWPVEHSLSPLLHNQGFDAVGHDGVHLPLPIPGGATEYEHFKATVGAMIDFPGLDFRGASVTIPHKENLLRFVRERGGRADPLTEFIGAANTLIVGSAGGLECANTDCPAAIASLCAGMGVDEHELTSKRIAVIGAGGAARAVIAGLIRAGATVVIFNRTRERAEKLADEMTANIAACGFASTGKVVVGKPDALACGCFHAFINCTPIGMAGGPLAKSGGADELPLPPEVHLDDSVAVMDTVYTPARTALIREAEARGARVITGLDMFVRQAALQFEKWTGATAPIDLFRAVLRSAP